MNNIYKPCQIFYRSYSSTLFRATMNRFSSVLAASPPWTAASPSAPDTWATRGPRCRTRPRTRSLASAPRRPPRPAAPRRRRGSSCLQVSWVTRSASVIAQDRHNHEALTHELAHTLLHNRITYGHRVCLCIRALLPQNYNSLEWQLKTTARFCVSGFLFFSCLTLTGCFYIHCSKCNILKCKIRFHEADLRASQHSSGPVFSWHKCEAETWSLPVHKTLRTDFRVTKETSCVRQ